MEPFELMSSDHFHVILHPDKEHGLIFNRLDGAITTIYYNDAKELSNLKTVGQIYGIVGRFLEKYLILIKSCSKVGSLYEPNSKTEHDVFMINQVQFVDISHKSTACIHHKVSSTNTDTNSSHPDNHQSTSSNWRSDEEYSMESFKRDENFADNDYSSLPVTFTTNSYNSAQSRATNWNPFKLANSLKPSQFLKSTPTDTSSVPSGSNNNNNNNQNTTEYTSPSQSQGNPQDDADRRLLEETMKLFNNTSSFYYSPTLDLTRRFSSKCLVRQSGNDYAWRSADERFFWNRFMLIDLIELSKQDSDANYFICVIMQGFISIEQHVKDPTPFDVNLGFENGQFGSTSLNVIRFSKSAGNIGDDCDNDNSTMLEELRSIRKERLAEKTYQLALVSRRSVFRAGTRYRRRGCDEHGNCANFVETEQIFRCKQHFTSLIILRGSIPLFWYQTGYNYRPPPVLTRNDEENHKALSEHFQSLMYTYNTEQIIAVDCTEHSGREKLLHDAYKQHLEKLQTVHPGIKLIEFDFHKHCRGRQCTDAQIEKNLYNCGLSDSVLKDVKFYWNDGDVIWNQEGVFRVNCLDCSDRTNVVQRAIALKILDLQLARLGIIEPDACPEENACRKIMELMWSANGNVLSTQYCGTRALFGGGDRKLSGYIKDTYSSASRYYISKFRDVYRQAAIDAMLGVESSDRKNLLNSTSFKDQYELIHFDPIIAGRTGSALLKDVGNKFTDRLARLKGRFNGRPYVHDVNTPSYSARSRLPIEVLETKLSDTLDEMSIDWPSTESVESCSIAIESEHLQDQQQDVFERFTSCEDNFQDDDEFGRLMLSMDLAELQQLREEEEDGEEEDQSEPRGQQGVDRTAKSEGGASSEAQAIANDQSAQRSVP